MKFIYIFILFFGFNSFAEDNMSNQISFKPVLGLTYSNLDYGDDYKSETEPEFEDSSDIAFTLGLLVEYKLNNLVFSSGLQYTSYKSEVSGETGAGIILDTTDLTVSHKLNYLQIPLNLSYYLDAEHSGFYGQIGLIPSFLLNASRDIKSSKPFYQYNGRSLEKDLKGFDMIANFGVGYTLPIHKYKYSIGLNYHLGLIKVDDSAPKESSKNSSFMLTLGMNL